MRYVGILILSLIAIFFGGCSLLITPTILTDGFGILPLLWLLGFGIAALCFLGIKKILARGKPADQGRAGTPGDRGRDDPNVN